MPEEQLGAVYNSGSGIFTLINYAAEKSAGAVSGTNGSSSSIFISRNQTFTFAASQASNVLTVIDKSSTGAGSYPLSLPGVYRVSVNPGGSAALAFVQDSPYVYYPRKLTAAQTIAYAGGPTTWPKAAVDCEPQTAPGWCLFQAQSPDNIDATNNYYGAPLVFDHPIKAVFSADGGTAYVLNCGPECSGTKASVSLLPVAPIIYLLGQSSGLLPSTGKITNIPTPGGASNALIDSSTMYLVGQEKMNDGYWGGHLTVLNLATNTISVPATSISDGASGAASRMVLADDNTLWIGMIGCINGERSNNSLPDGCLTMVNTTTYAVTLLPYIGNATGIAAVTGLHKVYTVENGQIYIYSTVNGSTLDNQYVTVTGTAYDVAYMDATSDSNNTVY
jgi:hypothetical protein